MAESGIQVTHAFLGEHAIFYALFDRLRTLVPKTDSVERIHDHASLLEAALLTHAELEERLLLHPLETDLTGPVQVMRAEHAHIEAELRTILSDQHREIGQAFTKLRTAVALPEARMQLLAVLDFARDHFAKEERILFPMSHAILGADRLRQLGAEWASQRRVQLS